MIQTNEEPSQHYVAFAFHLPGRGGSYHPQSQPIGHMGRVGDVREHHPYAPADRDRQAGKRGRKSGRKDCCIGSRESGAG